MEIKCAHLVTYLFLFHYEREFIVCLSNDIHADIIDAFNTSPDKLMIF